MIKLFDNSIAQSHTIPLIHPYLLLNLRFPMSFLSSIGLMDPLVSGKRELLRSLIRKSIIPLKAYAREYKQFAELYNIDVSLYMEQV